MIGRIRQNERTIKRGMRSHPPSACRLPTSAFRTGFTLVELLVTMIIISILAGITLGVLQKAHQAADTAKTRSMIARLHNQIMLRWEGYRTRRVPIASANPNPLVAASQRLAGMRELMRFELPERFSDFVEAPVVLTGLPKPANGDVPSWLTPAPKHTGVSAVSSAFLRRYMRNAISIPGQTPTPNKPTEKYEGAECLYMIITMNNEDDFAGAEQFKPKDSGDADGDGMPEFHDAWGQPIEFLRWAPGFISDLQPSLDGKDGTASYGLTDQTANPRQPNVLHDPSDALKLHKEAFTLFPLIYSGGIDRQTDIYRGEKDASGNPLVYRYSQHKPFVLGGNSMFNNPYGSMNLSGTPAPALPAPIGRPRDVDNDGDDGSSDNITNHLIGLR